MFACYPNEQISLRFKANNTSTAHLAGGAVVDLVEHYQQSQLYTATDKQLRNILEDLQERERTGQERMTRAANYATNFFWQVSEHFEVLDYIRIFP